ncbi:hypothetical protein [Aerosakkonema funiforme]|uniref:hypothetical protein n=1 Tax=Aerosakkonema funiforme TaxID=1246630 RepID=UPI001A7E9F0A|nr:hypothetical protein [Aerosakkonema funiforme]
MLQVEGDPNRVKRLGDFGSAAAVWFLYIKSSLFGIIPDRDRSKKSMSLIRSLVLLQALLSPSDKLSGDCCGCLDS